MNERIKELAEQANIHFSRVGILDGDPNGSARLVGYSKLEKFAELIVRQCVLEIKMTMVRDGYDTKHYLQSLKHIDHICKHFGVEE